MQENTDRNLVSASNICRLLKIKSLRSLQTTPGFPKPSFKEDELMFKKDKVMEFFNLDNLDEPFIDALDVAKYLCTSRGNVHTMARKGMLPSYRLKTKKGSAFLFKKSEIESFRRFSVERSVEPINFFISYNIMRDITLDLLNQTIEDKQSKKYKIIYGLVFERKTFTELSEELGITKQAIKQSCDITIKRILENKYHSPKAYAELEHKIAMQKREIDGLKNQLIFNNHLNIGDYNSLIAEKFVEVLDKDISELYIGVRGINALRAVGINTIYQLAKFCYKDNGFNRMLGLKNMGQKSISEIKDVLEEVNAKLSIQTGGINLPGLLKTDLMDKNRVLLSVIECKIGN